MESRWKVDDIWNKNQGYDRFYKRQKDGILRHNQFVSVDISSFYVTKFPKSIESSAMWHACACFGKVVDVFISPKKSQIGKHFAFCGFSGICNLDHMVKKLCDVWFGYFKLFSSIFRIFKTIASLSHNAVKSKVEKQQVPVNCYASVVRV